MATPGRELLAYERHQPAAARPATPSVPPRRDARPRWIAGAIGAALLLLVAGVAIGVVVRNGNVDDQRRRAASAQEQVSSLRGQVSSLREQVSSKQATIAAQQRQLGNLKSQLEQQRTAPTQPTAVDAATSFGDGLYQVGLAIQPGQYRTDGTGNCYWAKLSTGDTNKVIVNNLGSGPQTVTIDSPYFESEACGTWTKVG